MSIGKGLACSVAGGALGAGAWAMVGFLTGYELGVLAWGVGFLAGMGMAIGTGGRGSPGAGMLAAIIALASILTGKYFAVQLTLDDWLETSRSELSTDDAFEYFASEVHEEFAQQERSMTEPVEGQEFPPQVMVEAKSRWTALSQTEKEAYRNVAESHLKSKLSEARGFVGVVAFFLSFGFIGIIWIGLALSTAYKIAATNKQSEHGAQGEVAPSVLDDSPMMPPPTISTGFALPEPSKEMPRTRGFRMDGRPVGPGVAGEAGESQRVA